MAEEEEDKPKKAVDKFLGKRERVEALRGEMNRLRKELAAYRSSHFKLDETYQELTQDLEYQYLLKDGGFTVQEDHEYIVKRIYPSLDEIFHERPPVVRDLDSIDWKMLDNKIYIKEFFDEEEAKAEIAAMKLARANEAPDDHASFGDRIKRIRVEIPDEMKRDFENIIGQSIALRIGVISILLSLIIGYNYLISEGHVPKQARVATGVIMGLGFFGLSYFLYLRRYSIVSMVVSAGLLSLYYTVYVALHDYGIFTPWQAFAISILITASSVGFSLLFDRRELSVVAVFGSYLAPFLASKGSDAYSTFLAYLLFVNVGMLVLSYIKNWRIIHLISFVSTLVFMFYWIAKVDATDYEGIIGLFIYATLFHVLFYVMSIIFDLKDGVEFTDFDFYSSLTNSALYVLWALSVFGKLPHTGSYHFGVFLLLLAAFKSVYVLLLYGHSSVAEKLIKVQLAAILIFLNLAIYLIFEQNIYLNTLYALEAIGLLWLALKVEDEIMKAASVLALGLAIMSMGYAWYLTYSVYPEQWVKPFVNKGFWATLVNVSAILFTLHTLAERYKAERLSFMPVHLYATVLKPVLLAAVYFGLLFELLYHTRYIMGGSDTRMLLFFGYNLAFFLVGYFLAYQIQKLADMRIRFEWTFAIATVIYSPFGYYAASDLRDGFLEDHYAFLPFFSHYITTALMVYMVYLLVKSVVDNDGYQSSKYGYAVQLACVLFVGHATIEYEHIFVLVNSLFVTDDVEAILSQHRRTSFTIWWIMLAFFLMYLGMSLKIKEIRKMSLFLFALTIAKFFLVDFWRLEIIGKILALLITGTILIVVSQLYKKQLEVLIEEGNLVLDRDATLTQEQQAALQRLQNRVKKQFGGKKQTEAPKTTEKAPDKRPNQKEKIPDDLRDGDPYN